MNAAQRRLLDLVETYDTTWEFLADVHEVLIELHADELLDGELGEALQALDHAVDAFEEAEAE